MKPYGVVYKITNTVNGKIYVGQTIQDINKRWKQHIYQSRSRLNYPFPNAILKYGVESFVQEMLCECSSQEELDDKEKYFCDTLNAWVPNGYTLQAGKGRGSTSEETKNKISILKLGDKNPQFGKRGEKSPLFGIKRSEETNKKNSEAKKGKNNPNFGKHRPKEVRDKISSSHLGMRHSENTLEKLRKTYAFISPQGEHIIVNNMKDFCKNREVPLSIYQMYRVYSGINKKHKGWIRDNEAYNAIT